MLNIPEAVKALFKADSVRKNFRVVFPDGEYRDLTNSDIVANSVKFTESVCSKTVLQFGLAEASRIEFECVGVPNIYGATIECYCEIDASSLDAEYQAVKADVPYPVYAIPYGVFRVQSCPRSAGAMSHRRVEAYDIYGGERVYIPSVLSNKYNSYLPQTEQFLIQNIPMTLAVIDNSVAGLNATQTEVTGIDGSRAVQSSFKAPDGTVYFIEFLREYDLTGTFRSYITDTTDSVYMATYDADYSTVTPVLEKLAELGASQKTINYVEAQLVCGVMQSTVASPFPLPSDTVCYTYYNGYTSPPYIMLNTGNIIKVKIAKSTPAVVEVATFDIGTVISNFHLHRYQVTDTALLLMNMVAEPTNVQQNYNVYTDAVDFVSLVEGYAELNAEFRRSNRDGGSSYVELTQSSPIAMPTSEYSEMWWDEYSISPIGSIKYTYHDADLNQEQTMIYSFGAGLSEYDMTSNYLLKNLSITKADAGMELYEYVQGLLDTYFIPNISDIYFTPVDLSAIGLPYLEAGDYLEIDAGDGTTVGTYILSRTLNGEQYLTDDIQSQGGEIIGSTVRSA